jgi:hypothetical protein
MARIVSAALCDRRSQSVILQPDVMILIFDFSAVVSFFGLDK